MPFRSDNELLSPVRQRSQVLIPKLTADIEKIDERSLALLRFGYTLYEFLNVPPSLRSADLFEDMEATLLAERGASDELFEDRRPPPAAVTDIAELPAPPSAAQPPAPLRAQAI